MPARMTRDRKRMFVKIAMVKGPKVHIKDFATKADYLSYKRWYPKHKHEIHREAKPIIQAEINTADIPWWNKVPASARALFKRVYAEAMICKSSYQAKLAQECLAKLAPKIFGDDKDMTLFRPEDYAEAMNMPSMAGMAELVKTLKSLVEQYGAIDAATLDLVTREFDVSESTEKERSEKI